MKIKNLGASPRGMNLKIIFLFEASLGELNPLEGLKHEYPTLKVPISFYFRSFQEKSGRGQTPFPSTIL
jgi:hypothetical protein